MKIQQKNKKSIRKAKKNVLKNCSKKANKNV